MSIETDRSFTEVIGTSELLLGQTKPRLHTPFTDDLPTKGQELIDFADSLNMPLMPWQELVATEAHRIKPDGRWANSQVVALVSRQNGKSHLMRLRIALGLTEWGEKLQILSAHKLAVSLEHFNQVVELFENYDHLAKQVKKLRRANGQEEIQMLSGARFKVVANNAAGRGYAGAETIYLDELREHKDYAAWSAITKTQLAATNPMLMGFSNAGDSTSIVLNQLRERGMATMAGNKDSLLWLEWSAPMGCSLDDMSAWQAANPALGRTIHIDNLMATKNEPEAVVRTECLCQFVETLQSPWSPAAWSSCADLELVIEPGKPTYFAFDITPRRNHAALVGAQVLDDGKIAVGLVQEWKSETSIDDLEMANGVADWCRAYDVTEIQFSKNTGSAVASRLNAGGILAKAIDGRDFALACDQLLNAMEAGRLKHGDQQVLNRHIASSARINFADGGWIIGRRASNENVTAAVATAMVVSVATRQYSNIDIVVV
jgi:hypothetical protein